MKITNVRLTQLHGVLQHEGELWESRHVEPSHLYPEFRRPPTGAWARKVGENQYSMDSIFLHVDTDEGVSGLAGPVGGDVAAVIRRFKGLLIGQDPRANERLWDTMYRHSVHGRKGVDMMAISAIDCALWDIKGKWAGVPVYRLLGGPTTDALPAYGSAQGFSYEPERVRQHCRSLVAQGFRSIKWFFPYGPGDGREGMKKNVDLVRTVREAVGDDVDVMLDAWMGWDVPYAIAMAERIEEFEPYWLEEPVLPDRIDSYAAIRRSTTIPIAGGEHEYTRWGEKMLLDAEAVDVLQPDIYWAGGLSETFKICVLASTYDVKLSPHAHSVPTNVQLAASLPPDLFAPLEFQVGWNRITQFFLKNPVLPREGVFRLPEGPGMGIELDESKILEQREI